MTARLLRGLAILSCAGLLFGCNKPAMDKGQVLARVNGDEISVHQLTAALAQGSARPQSVADQTAMLDKMIDRQLAVQQALALKLDRRSDVMMRLEESRRDILASAYAVEVSAGARGPTEDEVARYYRDHPVLFAERKIFRLREISLSNEAPAFAETLQRLEQKQDLPELLAWLKQQPGSFTDQAVLRPAEQLPVEAADRLYQVKPGEVISFRLPRSLLIYQMQAAENASMAWTTAEPVIREHLKRQQDAERLRVALAKLRSEAKIERQAPPQ